MTETPYTISDVYTCQTCGQGVLTTLGQHFCSGQRGATGVWISTTTSTPSTLWNGPICTVCHNGYIGTHDCPGSETEHLRDANDALREENDRLRRKLRKAKRRG